MTRIHCLWMLLNLVIPHAIVPTDLQLALFLWDLIEIIQVSNCLIDGAIFNVSGTENNENMNDIILTFSCISFTSAAVYPVDF